MKVLVDTNVVLDVLLAREPHLASSAQLFSLADNERIDGAICATTVTTVHYLATKAVGRGPAMGLESELLDVFAVAPVDRQVLVDAASLDFDDFEDAVIHAAARAWGAAGIVTRDGRGFAKAGLPVFEPHELLSAIVAAQEEDPGG